MSANVRIWLRDQLKPSCPPEWVWIPTQRMPATLAKTTVILKHLRIEPLDEAPVGHLRHTVVLTVADPRTDSEAAEDALDEAVTELITALDEHDKVAWTLAEKALAGDPNATSYLAWDLTLSTITAKEA